MHIYLCFMWRHASHGVAPRKHSCGDISETIKWYGHIWLQKHQLLASKIGIKQTIIGSNAQMP